MSEDTASMTDFVRDFKLATMSQATMREFKKRQGEDLLKNLLKIPECFKAHSLKEMLELTQKIDRMNDSMQGRKAEAKPKAKAAGKGRAKKARTA